MCNHFGPYSNIDFDMGPVALLGLLFAFQACVVVIMARDQTSPPSSPDPPGSFRDAPEKGGSGWRRGGVLGRQRGGEGGPPSGTWVQTHI